MGSNMVRRLLHGGHECIVFDDDMNKVQSMSEEGAIAAKSLEEAVSLLSHPRLVWLMLPAGEPTEGTVRSLQTWMEAGDILIDGGNSHFKDDVARSKYLSEKGIRYLDVGVSGGVWGLERGYCLMIGGNQEASALLEPLFLTLAGGQSNVTATESRNPRQQGSSADLGYFYCGAAGSGHFVKMIHNGIEYGMMQALAEGFHLLQGASKESIPSDYRYALDLTEISEVWRRGSVISSWLLDLIANSLNQDPNLASFVGRVEDSGEGRWTVQAALEEAVPAEVITTALYVRFRSRESESFAEKMISAMRNQFGGHVERKRAA
jgi:6-phosphogluconate dehydrogenase